MSTHRASVITFAGALALLLTAATTVNAREYNGERTWSGKTSTEKYAAEKRGGTRGENRDGVRGGNRESGRETDVRDRRPANPVFAEDRHDWRDNGYRGRHHGRYNRWHRFDRDGDFHRPRWQRRAWWHRYW